MTASAKSALVDFLFTGVGVVPLALVVAGAPGLALMLACPLLIGACLSALYLEGPAFDGPDDRNDRAASDGGARKPHDDYLVRRALAPEPGASAGAYPFAAALAPVFLPAVAPAFAPALAVAARDARSMPRRSVPALLRPKEAEHVPAVDGSAARAWLVPLDGTPESLAAIDYVIGHARPERTRIHLLNVQPPVMAGDVSVLTSAATIVELRRKAGEDALREARSDLRAHGFEHTSDVVFGIVAEEIVRCAAQRGCEKIVMSARRTGRIGNILGRSVSARVLRRAQVPVTIVKAPQHTEGAREGFRFA